MLQNPLRRATFIARQSQQHHFTRLYPSAFRIVFQIRSFSMSLVNNDSEKRTYSVIEAFLLADDRSTRAITMLIHAT